MAKTGRFALWTRRALTALAALVTASAVAQSYPTRPITMIWPYAPGSPGDIGLKELNNEASKSLGQPIVMDYKPGAGGRLGPAAVARAAPDGYMFSVATDVILCYLPHASETFKLQLGRDYDAVFLMTETPQILLAHPKVPFNDVKGLVAYAKQNPGKLTFGSTGVGGSSHLSFEKFMYFTGINMVHIPYKGQVFAMADQLAGRIDFTFLTSGIKQYLDSGQLKALGITSRQRIKATPDIPTLAEQGFGDASNVSMIGIIAPPKTPRDIVMKVHGALAQSYRNPAIVKAMENAGFDEVQASPEEYATRLRASYEAYGRIQQKLNLKMD